MIDSFPFYSEHDIFLSRINYLDSAVDHFVIVEADHSFTMQPHASQFDRVYQQLRKSQRSKIVYEYLRVDTTGFQKLDLKNQGRAVETQIRNRQKDLIKATRGSGLVAMSDSDEFWDKRLLSEALEMIDRGGRMCWLQEYRVCFVDWKGRYGHWPGTKMGLIETLPENACDFYCSKNKSYGTFPEQLSGGWHLTIMGDRASKAQQISAKREAPSWEQKVNRTSQSIADAVFANGWNTVVKKSKMKAEKVGTLGLDPELARILETYPDLWSGDIQP